MLVGLETGDDAAIYRIDERVALVLTTDFFAPIVDDPFAPTADLRQECLGRRLTLCGLCNLLCRQIPPTPYIAHELAGGRELIVIR